MSPDTKGAGTLLTSALTSRVAAIAAASLVWVTGASGAPAWVAPPEDVSPAFGREPVVVMDDAGVAHAAWIADGDVLVARRPPGGPWGPPQNLTVDIPDQPAQLTLRGNRGGDVAAAWLTTSPTGGLKVFVSLRVRSASVFPPPLGPAGTNPTSLALAVDDAGNTDVAWAQSGGVSVNRVVPGPAPTWESGTPQPLGGVFVTDLEIAAAASGRVIVAFSGNDGPARDIFLFRREAGSAGWAGGNVTNDGRVDFDPAVALGADGTAHLAWGSTSAPGEPDEVRVGRNAPGTATITAVAPVGSATSPNPQIAVSAAGATAVAYEADNDTLGAAPCDPIRLLVRPPGGVFGPPVVLGNGTGLALRGNAAGDLVAVWRQTTGLRVTDCQVTENRIARVRSADGGGAVMSFGSATSPSAWITSNGSAVAVASLGPTGTGVIRAAGFDTAPPVLSGLSVPATATSGQAVAMSVAVADAWRTGTTNWDFGDGTAATGAAVSKVFASPGTYTVTVSHTDAAGFSVSSAAMMTVAAPVAPPAAGGPAPAAPPRLRARARLRAAPVRTGFRVASLTVTGAARTRITVRCLTGCPVRRSLAAGPARRALAALFSGRVLRPGTVVEVRFTRPGFAGRAFRFTIARRVVARVCDVRPTGRVTGCRRV